MDKRPLLESNGQKRDEKSYGSAVENSAHDIVTGPALNPNQWSRDRSVSAVDSPVMSMPFSALDSSDAAAFHSVRSWWSAYASQEKLDAIQNESVREFYGTQNELLEAYRKYSTLHTRYLCEEDSDFVRNHDDNQEPESGADASANADMERGEKSSLMHQEQERKIKSAITVSNVCNFVLLFSQLVAFLSSHSLALMANLIDAALDMVSGLVILVSWRVKSIQDRHKYPIGRSRSEPLGVILMACFMTAATLLTLEESIQCLLSQGKERAFQGLTPSVVLLVTLALGTKLLLFLYCRAIDDASVQSLAMDHLNDVISNISSLSAAFLAQYIYWAVDPAGGIAISLMIIRNWFQHTQEHVDNLLGRVASAQFHSLVTFLACNHHHLVLKVDTVRCYHLGSGIFVEVDIVLPEHLPLREAHDIGEALQVRIESIEHVERAFVHLDTESDHSPDIEHKVI